MAKISINGIGIGDKCAIGEAFVCEKYAQDTLAANN